MSPRLPVEAMEHTITFLRGDQTSLAACSLTCRALLPISRVELWHEVVLTIEEPDNPYYGLRTTALLGILHDNPAIAPYIRSLVMCPRVRDVHVPFGRASLDVLSASLPALRSMRFRGFTIRNLHVITSTIRDFPTLEVFYLEDISTQFPTFEQIPLAPPHLPDPLLSRPGATASGHQPEGWALRKLSIIGGSWTSAEVSQLVLFLERTTTHISLESLGLCCSSHFMGLGELGENPSDLPPIPSFGGSQALRHFGITLSDINGEGGILVNHRNHMCRTISALSRCSSLRSLRLCYDRNFPFFMHGFREERPPEPPRGHAPTSSFFLEHLADVLSAPGPTPLPHLEHLTLVFLSSPSWLAGFEAAFARLAEALVGEPDGGPKGARDTGTARKYPRFSRLDVRTVSLAGLKLLFGDRVKDEQEAKQMAERDDLVLPMLSRFIEAGVHVEVTCV